MRNVPLALWLACFLSQTTLADEAIPHTPQLLLSAKLIRRLKRDRDRQTVRWTAFENRVKNVPDSPERGFELALYYAITTDNARAKEAIGWAVAHPCEYRQTSMIRDWVGVLPSLPCSIPPTLREQAFEQISSGADASDVVRKTHDQVAPQLVSNGIKNFGDLYATIELLSILRSNGGDDLRSVAPQFFRNLPVEFLLSLKPEQVERPDWMTHVAALALVTLDPNLEASQFLQGWAIEDRQTLHEGPGVAYELLWADPYLPGIAYQNLDPWLYDPDGGRLFARSDWSLNACWIKVAAAGFEHLNCQDGWRDRPIHFGSLTLMPMGAKCIELPRQEARQSVVVWKLGAGETIAYRDKKEINSHADGSGLWRPGGNVEGKVCRR